MFDPLSLCRDARRFPAMNGRSLPVRTLRHSSKLVLPILIAVLTAVATMGIVGGLSTADHGTVGPSTESLLARGAIAPPAVSGSTPLTSSATSPPVYETGTVVAAFGLQGWPTEVAYDSANGEVYVANNLATNVSVISGTAVVASVNVHRAPFGVAYDSGNGEVYVTDSDNVSLISGTAVVATFGLQGGPGALAYDSGTGEVFIANSEWGSVSVISGTTVVANVSVQGGPAAVAYDSENGEVYVVNEFSNSVSVISGTTVVANVSVQSYPAGVAYDSGNGEVYVADSGSNNVSVISGTTVVATVGVQGEPTAVAYDSGNGDVYVGNYENSVSVISGTNLLATIFDNYGAFDAAYDSGNGEVYVANYGSNSMYVISTMLDLGGLAGRTALDVGQAASLSAAVIGPGAGITRVSAQVSPSTGFSCSPNASSNARVSISCQASSAGSYTVTLYAVDELGNGVWTSCLVNVYTDPSVLHPIPSRPSADVGQSIVFSTLASGGGPGSAYQYAWSAPVVLGCAPSSTSSLTCLPSAPVVSGTVNVNATDADGFTSSTVSSPYSVSVDPTIGAPAASPATLDVGQNTTLSASGAVGTGLYPTYTWVGLPQGCQSANATSLVCTPLTSGIFSVTASLRDSNAYNVVSATLRLVVSPALKSPTLNASARTVNTGSVLVLTVSVMGGAAPYSYVWSGLPTGCTAAVSSAVVACTPSAAGAWEISVMATDANGEVSGPSNPVPVDVVTPTKTASSSALAYTNTLLYVVLGLAVAAFVLAAVGLWMGLRRDGGESVGGAVSSGDGEKSSSGSAAGPTEDVTHPKVALEREQGPRKEA